MNILALDSSGAVASVAVFCDGRIRGEYSLNHKLTHSQTIMPMMDELCKRAEYDIARTDVIAVAAGPGSFTGLRIGAAAAKGMAFALGVKMMPVPTLLGLSYQFWGADSLICPMMDARRSQIYSGIYRFEGGSLSTVSKGEALALDEQLGRLEASGEEAIVLGDGVDVHIDAIRNSLGDRCLIAPAHRRYQSAACIAQCAADMLAKGVMPVASEDFAPEYLRRSQAEREREERLSGAVN